MKYLAILFLFIISVQADILSNYEKTHKPLLPIVYMPDIYLMDINNKNPYIELIFNIDKHSFISKLSIHSKTPIKDFDHRIKTEFIKEMKIASIPTTCNDKYLKEIIKEGFSVKYNFYFNKNEFIDYFIIDKKDCNFKD